jgi:hypothetical protein
MKWVVIDWVMFTIILICVVLFILSYARLL